MLEASPGAGCSAATPTASSRSAPPRDARAFQPFRSWVHRHRAPTLSAARFVRIRPNDAKMRLIEDGELVWVYGPRRHELAPVVYDEPCPRAASSCAISPDLPSPRS
jgi:hypothetical protein